MKNKAVLNKWFFYLVVVWFVSSILFGVCFEMLGAAAPYTAERYLWVSEYIENYARFSWIIFFNLLEVPIFLFLLWRYGVGSVVINHTARLALGAVLLSSLVGLLGLIEVRGNGAFSRLVQFLMRELDWLGASFFFFLIGYSFVVSLMLLLKHKGGVEDV